MFHALRITAWAALTASILITSAALAEQAASPVSAAQVVAPDNPEEFALSGNGLSKAEAKILDVTGQPFTRAWRVKVIEKVGADYNLQFTCKPKETLKPGDVILLTAHARMIDTADESGQGRVTFVLEQAKDPFGKVFASSFGVGRQ